MTWNHKYDPLMLRVDDATGRNCGCIAAPGLGIFNCAAHGGKKADILVPLPRKLRSKIPPRHCSACGCDGTYCKGAHHESPCEACESGGE